MALTSRITGTPATSTRLLTLICAVQFTVTATNKVVSCASEHEIKIAKIWQFSKKQGSAVITKVRTADSVPFDKNLRRSVFISYSGTASFPGAAELKDIEGPYVVESCRGKQGAKFIVLFNTVKKLEALFLDLDSEEDASQLPINKELAKEGQGAVQLSIRQNGVVDTSAAIYHISLETDSAWAASGRLLPMSFFVCHQNVTDSCCWGGKYEHLLITYWSGCTVLYTDIDRFHNQNRTPAASLKDC